MKPVIIFLTVAGVLGFCVGFMIPLLLKLPGKISLGIFPVLCALAGIKIGAGAWNRFYA